MDDGVRKDKKGKSGSIFNKIDSRTYYAQSRTEKYFFLREEDDFSHDDICLAIKLSDSAFSAMKDRLGDANDENDSGEVKAPKPAVTAEKNPPPTKAMKPNKPTATAVTLKQALQNVSTLIFECFSFAQFFCFLSPR